MAVAFDSVGPSSAGTGHTGATALSWTHTTSGGPCLVLVGAEVDSIATSVPSTATCDGASMTSIGIVAASAGNNGYCQVFSISGISSGSHTIVVTPGTGAGDVAAGSVAFTGAGGLGTVFTASATGTVTVTSSTSGNLCAGFIAAGDNVNATTAPSTSRYLNNLMAASGNGAGNIAGATSPSTGSSVTMAWTLNTANSGGIVAVEVQVPAAAAGGVAQAAPGQTWLRRFHHRQQLPPPAAVVTAAAPPAVQPLQPRVLRPGPHRGALGRFGACAAGILAATTLSPQPAAVPPSRPQPVIQHPAPHRATAKGRLAPQQLPFTTAKLPPTAISPRPQHRAFGKGILAKTTFAAQPSIVYPMPQPVPIRRPGPHRAIWDTIAGPPPPAVVVTAATPARPLPVTNRPPPPHRAIGKGVLAPTTFSPQPARVPPPQWRQPNAPRPAHRAIWRGIAGPPPPVVVVTTVPPSRPLPTVNRPPPPHRATGKGILGKTTLSPQPSSVPAPGWRPQPRFIAPHRAAWRLIIGPAPAVVAPAVAAPSRPRPVTNRPPAPHRAITRQLLAKTTLSAQPVRVSGPQWRQPFAPRPAHRAIWRRVAGAAPPPPPFTVGTLSGATAATTTVAGATASNALAGSTAPSGAITAADTRTGGPS